MALKIPTSVLSHNNFKLSGIMSLFTFFSMAMFISINAVWISVSTKRSWCEASLNTWSHGSLPTITWLWTLLYAIPWSMPTAAFWKSSYVVSRNFVSCKQTIFLNICSHNTNCEYCLPLVDFRQNHWLCCQSRWRIDFCTSRLCSLTLYCCPSAKKNKLVSFNVIGEHRILRIV